MAPTASINVRPTKTLLPARLLLSHGAGKDPVPGIWANSLGPPCERISRQRAREKSRAPPLVWLDKKVTEILFLKTWFFLYVETISKGIATLIYCKKPLDSANLCAARPYLYACHRLWPSGGDGGRQAAWDWTTTPTKSSAGELDLPKYLPSSLLSLSSPCLSLCVFWGMQIYVSVFILKQTKLFALKMLSIQISGEEKPVSGCYALKQNKARQRNSRFITKLKPPVPVKQFALSMVIIPWGRLCEPLTHGLHFSSEMQLSLARR